MPVLLEQEPPEPVPRIAAKCNKARRTAVPLPLKGAARKPPLETQVVALPDSFRRVLIRFPAIATTSTGSVTTEQV